VRHQRAAWQAKIKAGQLPVERLVFVDESGVNASMTRLYAWAERGKRAYGHVPKNWGENVTILNALGVEGPLASMHLPGATDGEVFLAFVQRVLVPALPPKAIVVMDNLGAHRMAAVGEHLAKAAAELHYLPPYSHDFNPMEQAWSKVKSLMRKASARTSTTLKRAIAQALQSISTQDARAYFTHCGYGLPKH